MTNLMKFTTAREALRDISSPGVIRWTIWNEERPGTFAELTRDHYLTWNGGRGKWAVNMAGWTEAEKMALLTGVLGCMFRADAK